MQWKIQPESRAPWLGYQFPVLLYREWFVVLLTKRQEVLLDFTWVSCSQLEPILIPS